MFPFWFDVPFSTVAQILPAVVAALTLFSLQLFGRSA